MPYRKKRCTAYLERLGTFLGILVIQKNTKKDNIRGMTKHTIFLKLPLPICIRYLAKEKGPKKKFFHRKLSIIPKLI
jgi:hypothetical protein